MSIDSKKNFIIQMAYVAVLILLLVVIGKYLLPLLMPFAVGLILALIVRGIAKPLIRRLKIDKHKRLVHLVILILVYIIIISLLAVGGVKLWNLAKDFFNSLPELYLREIQPAMNNIYQRLTERFPSIQDMAQASYQSINNSLIGMVEKASNTVLNSLTGVAGTLTNLVLKIIFTLISSVIFTLDLDRMQAFLKRQMSERTAFVYDKTLSNVGRTVFLFLRAYSIIIAVTFTELFIGFSLLKFSNPAGLALGIALMDALPVVGTGTLMVPWILYTLLIGNIQLAIGLSVLYAIIFVVRQSIEPKVVGDQIGLHPIIMVICIYVGGRLFGLMGIFLLPMALTIVNKLNRDGVIKVLK